MTEEQKSLENENGELLIAIENKNLEDRYQELIKEINEKTVAMEQNVDEKSKGTSEIEEKMNEQLSTQEEDIKKQIELYKSEAIKKENEEAELSKVLNDYKTRFGEFDKSLKQSRKTLQQYDKESAQLTK